GGEGGAADCAQVDVDDLVFGHAERGGHAHGGGQFGGVALAIRHAQRVHGEALLARNGGDDGGIHATGNEDDGFFHAEIENWEWGESLIRRAGLEIGRAHV